MSNADELERLWQEFEAAEQRADNAQDIADQLEEECDAAWKRLHEAQKGTEWDEVPPGEEEGRLRPTKIPLPPSCDESISPLPPPPKDIKVVFQEFEEKLQQRKDAASDEADTFGC